MKRTDSMMNNPTYRRLIRNELIYRLLLISLSLLLLVQCSNQNYYQKQLYEKQTLRETCYKEYDNFKENYFKKQKNAMELYKQRDTVFWPWNKKKYSIKQTYSPNYYPSTQCKEILKVQKVAKCTQSDIVPSSTYVKQEWSEERGYWICVERKKI